MDPSDLRRGIEELDRDGALRETAAEAAEAETSRTRGGFLRAGAALAGGGLPAVLAACGGSDSSSKDKAPKAKPPSTPATAAKITPHGPGARLSTGLFVPGDVGILNFALVLEYLEAGFYAEAVARDKLQGEARNFARVVGKHEASHVEALSGAISKAGGTPAAKPKFDFFNTTTDQGLFEKTSKALEDTGVKAYLGQSARIVETKYLASAASILAVEARHAAWIADIIDRGKPTSNAPSPGAVATAATMAEILKTVQDTGFIRALK